MKATLFIGIFVIAPQMCAAQVRAAQASAALPPTSTATAGVKVSTTRGTPSVRPVKAPPPLVLEHVERVSSKAFPPESEENLTEFRRDVQRQWKKCLQLNDLRVIQAKDFRTNVRELCVETSRRTHHLLMISKNWKQFYQRAQQQFAWYRLVADADKKTHDIDVRLLPLSMIPTKQPGEFYFPIPKKLLNTY